MSGRCSLGGAGEGGPSGWEAWPVGGTWWGRALEKGEGRKEEAGFLEGSL